MRFDILRIHRGLDIVNQRVNLRSRKTGLVSHLRQHHARRHIAFRYGSPNQNKCFLIPPGYS